MDNIKHIARQLHNICPSDCTEAEDLLVLQQVSQEANSRFSYLASRVLMLTRSGNQPDAWHIMKHPIYIYILARVLYEKNVSDGFRVKDRLNSLNMALHSCSMYYKIALPRVFFLNYATQVVLGDCTYGENLVVYQGVTVGGYRNKVPVLGQNVVLMPNSVIAGATTLGNNVVVSAGVAVINKIVPDDTIVFAGGPNGELIYHPLKNNQYIDYFVSTPQ